MRNLIRADLRRVYRKHIYWIIPALLVITGVIGIASSLSVGLLSKSIPILALLAKQNHSEIISFTTRIGFLDFALTIIVFLVLYVDDFKSMSMIGMIGYGLSRKKIVISKFITSCILCVLFYLIFIPLVFVICAVFKAPLRGDWARFVFMTGLFSMLKTISNITIAALVLYITNNYPLGIFAVIILKIIPVGLTMASASPLIGRLHLDRFYMEGMFNMASTYFLMGLAPEGIGMTLLCVCLYIGLILLGTILYFDRKELDF